MYHCSLISWCPWPHIIEDACGGVPVYTGSTYNDKPRVMYIGHYVCLDVITSCSVWKRFVTEFVHSYVCVYVYTKNYSINVYVRTYVCLLDWFTLICYIRTCLYTYVYMGTYQYNQPTYVF